MNRCREPEPAHARWSRRQVLGALLAASPFGTRAARPDYPRHAIRLVVPSAAGSASDWVARLLCAELERDLGQAIVVDNRAGASTIVGTEVVAEAPADGHTLGYVMPAFALNRALGMSLPYDSERRFRPVVQTGWQPEVLVAHPGLGVTTLQGLLTRARERPGALSYASSGPGSIFHLSTELLRAQTGIEMLHVPHSSSTVALTNVASGHVDQMFNALSAALGLIQEGRLVALAVTSEKPSPVLPGVATMQQGGVPGYEVLTWGGIVAPAGVSDAICTFLNERFNAALAQPAIRAALAVRGYEAVGGTAERFGAFIRSEIEKWTRVARFAGLRP